jgi:hypothetical protein
MSGFGSPQIGVEEVAQPMVTDRTFGTIHMIDSFEHGSSQDSSRTSGFKSSMNAFSEDSPVLKISTGSYEEAQ